MTTPFQALQPHEPRVVEILYEAAVGPCWDVTDLSDVSDATDVTDGEGEIII